MREKKSRSLFKTFTWRVAALVSCYVVLASFEIEFWTSVKVVLVMNTVHMTMYYVHERIWNSIDYGRE